MKIIEITDSELSDAIYLYFKNKLDDFVREGISKAQDLADKISSNAVDREGTDPISHRYKALLEFQSLPPVDRNDKLRELLITPDQLPIDFFLKKDVIAKFLYSLFLKEEEREDAEDCYFDAIKTVFEKSSNGSLEITKTIEDYLFIVARNNWIKFNKKKIKGDKLDANFDYIDSLSEENPYTGDHSEEIYESIVQILEKSEPKCIDLFKDYYFNNKSWEEIAEKHHYRNRASACSQGGRCRTKLRIKLESMGITSIHMD